MMRTALASVPAALLLACGDSDAIPATESHTTVPDSTFVYECAGGFTFVSAILGDTAWAFLPSGTVALLHRPAASGAKYGRGDVVLWMKGEEATLELTGEQTRGCRNDRASAIWEHAKLKGAGFRGVGNEPGWHVEIAPDSIRLVTDYGERRGAYPTPSPDVDSATARTSYRTASGADTLEVVLERGPCHDVMSGELFETTVTVVVDGRTLRGCGRALH